MATPRNSGKTWTTSEESKLRNEVKGNTPTRVIALKHGRSEDSIRSKAQDLGVSLRPVNQSPYGTGGKRRK